jgi:hypothetical protein
MQSLWLWQESGTTPGFDPATDIRLQSAMVQGSQLLFDALGVAVPAGGQRFYVTLDTTLMPTAGRRVALRIPCSASR